MIRKIFLLLFTLSLSTGFCRAQYFINTADLFRRSDQNFRTGRLTINQDQGIDSLMYRYILYNQKLKGLDGFRIQIYSRNTRNAREESGKVRQLFMSRFPDIVSYASFAEPGYYKVRVGDFRTKNEAIRYLLMIRREFPDAYMVPDIINFPDLNKK
ncbi:MAG TPA: SPOR domain-containing protein [Bacteroidales bacterium]|nr:SPOR domain-containing protein [Bacteroidales bacterium]